MLNNSSQWPERYAIYARVSVHTACPDGIAEQVRVCQAAAENLNPQLTLAQNGIFPDARTSGTKGRVFGFVGVIGHSPGSGPTCTKLAVVEPEAAVVRRIFQEFASGSPTLQIAAGLNAEHVLTPNCCGTRMPWTARRVYSILRNALYRGILECGRSGR